MDDIIIDVPCKLYPIFHSTKKYNIIKGGRAKGSSWTFGIKLISKCFEQKVFCICIREIQDSIKNSVYRVLSETIKRYDLGSYFDIQDKTIKGPNGSEFIFLGMYRNIETVKSTEGLTDCWVSEANKISQNSWDILIPTVRTAGSQFWIDYNPEFEDDPVNTIFTKDRDDCFIIESNYLHNEYCPQTLIEEAEYMRKTDYDKYCWVWLGQYKRVSDAQIFKGKYRVEDFETPEDAEFYHGADWGFSADPTVLVRCYIKGKTLYIDQESYGEGVDIDYLPMLFDQIDTSRKWGIVGDKSRPETISYLNQRGFTITHSAGSKIEDGISFIRSFEMIIIHSRCIHTIKEFDLYSYKIDKLTGKPTPLIDDKNNHCIDALRYALEPVQKGLPSIFFA